MNFDVIVVGGGHAGIEAVLAAARMGYQACLITLDISNIGQTPCNPSIGGPAKGVVVREIDALGGQMGITTDNTYIQMKMLNTAKGPGVQCLRAQIDKLKYPKYMQDVLMNEPNVTILETMVKELIVKDNVCLGVIDENGNEIYSKTTILTTGTYMESTILVGHDITSSGPFGQRASLGLSPNLEKLGFNMFRLKTGTPARVKASTIDFSKAELQEGTDRPLSFSYETTKFIPIEKQYPCYLIHTTDETKKIIQDNLDKSAMYSGNVKGRGPRYCPSIEDKIVRFADKERHQLFLEPESADNDSIYKQGFSTSMPIDVQEEMVHSLPGLEKAEFYLYAYAIEYDAIYPTQLKLSLETKLIENLFSAGQINGTSGYVEAAAQGLMGGINAVRKIQNKEPLILKRNESYIGLMIDDIVTKGTNEPYRLLTSRSEYRLLLRNDNADLRLRKYGYDVGLVKQDVYDRFIKKVNDIEELTNILKERKVTREDNLSDYMKEKGYDDNVLGMLLYDLIKRPFIELKDILSLITLEKEFDRYVIEEVEIQVKYEGYLKKHEKEAKEQNRLELHRIPNDINYDEVPHLALEARQKLKEIRPETIGQASRISGVNPADISVLMVYLKLR